MRRALLAAPSLFSLIYEVNAVTEPGWLPDRATIDKIEAALVMPDGAPPLSSYRRRYGGAIENGRRMIGAFSCSRRWRPAMTKLQSWSIGPSRWCRMAAVWSSP